MLSQERLEEMFLGNTFGCIKFTRVFTNALPHMYTITSKHLERNDSIYLGESQIRRMEAEHGPMCGHPECNLFYEEHQVIRIVIIDIPLGEYNSRDWMDFCEFIKQLFGDDPSSYGIGFEPSAYAQLQEKAVLRDQEGE